MGRRNIKRMTLATFSLAACVALCGALAAGQAQARGGGAGGHALAANLVAFNVTYSNSRVTQCGAS